MAWLANIGWAAKIAQTLGAALFVGLAVAAACSAGDDNKLPGPGIDASIGGEGGAGAGTGTGTGGRASLCSGSDCSGALPPECDGGARITVTSYQPGKELEGVEDEGCSRVVDWSDAGAPGQTPDAGAPPEEEFDCPEGQTRVHVRDMWSSLAAPTLDQFADRPLYVVLVTPNWDEYAARPVSAGCDWYTACVPLDDMASFQLKAAGPSACSPGDASGAFDVSGIRGSKELWVHYTGSALAADYSAFPSVPLGDGAFRLSTDRSEVEALLCPPGKPDTSVPDGYTKLHVRWPWGEPDRTGFPGTACGDEALGFDVPPYPTSLRVEREGCASSHATLEFQDNSCPWYSVLIPSAEWTGRVTLRYPDNQVQLFTPAIPLPQPRAADEYWLGYAGAPDDVATFGTACMNFSQRTNAYYFYTENPGPGYVGCGSTSDVPVDPCNPPVPDGYSTVHFRYIWAGQKTFTFFPKPELMPRWIVLEVNGGGGDKDVICFREADRPWFNCPVPDSEFYPGATWRAVDKGHDPEWNTVAARPFPATPGEYWLRWHYGKPDIPATSEFKFYDYYPDGTGGDWSATGEWGDQSCAPKPPPTPLEVGFGEWFPYDRTGYAYPFGSSLARTFPDPDTVQDLLNTFVFERYLIWRENYVERGALVCGDGTARVRTDPPETVSEGQGYGMALAAVIGDKPLFDELWRFVRHNLSQSAKKFCGGLMGWMWDGASTCRPIDSTCDPDSGACGGNQDSAFDGDVDIGIALVFAARQWPEYTEAAVSWILKMECEVNAAYDGTFHYPTPGDTWDKSCERYPDEPCFFRPGYEGSVNLSYYPPGYFRVFGDFLAASLDRRVHDAAAREQHRAFWYKTAETVYELLERCYDQPGVHPALVTDWGHYGTPCDANTDNYNWARALWRVAVDAAWFGNRSDLPENRAGSSRHYPPKSQMQAKIEHIQEYFAGFHQQNPPEPNANRFSTLCDSLTPDGATSGCDPAFGHNSYFVNTAMSAYAVVFDNGGATTPAIRREALEEAVSTTVQNDRYYQESIGVYTLLFLTGNFPNPMEVPR